MSFEIKHTASGQLLQELQFVGGYFCVVMFSCLVTLCTFMSLSYYNSEVPNKLGQTLSTLASNIGAGTWVADHLLFISVKQFVVTAFVFFAFLLIGVSIIHGKTKLIRFCYRNRFLIALAVLIVSILLKLNGTSLYRWSDLLSGAEQYKPLFGSAKEVRGDEWTTWSVFTIAQGFDAWPAVSRTIAGGDISSLWISVGGIPALNLALIFKPLYWGFLLLGTERGFSFLWTLRFLLLFLVSFEFAMRYTDKKPWLSFCAAMMITFSPYVQWWYSQSVAEVLIFSQAMLLCLMSYVKCNSKKKRILLAVLLAYCIGCYAMIAYISWLISTFYVVLTVAVVILISNRKLLSKADIPTLLLPMVMTAAYLLFIAFSDWTTLESVQNSIYPGERLITGGGLFDTASYFTGLYSLFLPFTSAPMLNSSELSGFLTFAPAGMILACYSVISAKKKDALSIALIVFELACLYFLIVGVPAVFAKVTLLSQVTRMNIALGLADITLLFRSLSHCKDLPVPLAAGCTLACTTFSILMLLHFYKMNGLTLAAFIVIYLVIYNLLFCYPYNSVVQKRTMVFSLFCLMLSVGAFVNPIQQGISCVTETNLIKTLDSIENTTDDVYIVEGSRFFTNTPLLAGKTCFNSTQVYPNTEKWEAVDPTGRYKDIYNRFCHISLNLIENKTRFQLMSTDFISIDFCMDDLETYGIHYLITTKDYSVYHNCNFTLVGVADEWNVYQITYTDATP
jgi:hypothetical protein